MQLSVVIITFNEARNIGRCLDSIAGIADDVVVVDSYSTDETEQICRDKGARFFQRPFAGYIDQKNWANEQALHPYILSLDADEALSDTLRQSILSVKQQGGKDGYALNRRTNYCGQWINHSGWYPDRKIRLFDRRRARWGGTTPHEWLVLDDESSVGFLPGDLLHYSYYTVEEHYARARKYADAFAHAKFAQGKRGSWFRILFSPAFKFVRNYIFRLGILDGRAGWTICRIAALETYWKYRRLLELEG